MSENNTITNDSGDPKYYIMTPQIVLALCTSPYEYTLWNVIKNIAGELGECFVSTTDLATLGMMSTGECSKCRKSLIAKGLLTGEVRKDPGYPQPVWHLTVPNLWAVNTSWREAHQSLLDRIKIKEQQMKALHQVKPSPGEQGIIPGEGGIAPGETKNNQQEKQKEEPSLTLQKIEMLTLAAQDNNRGFWDGDTYIPAWQFEEVERRAREREEKPKRDPVEDMVMAAKRGVSEKSARVRFYIQLKQRLFCGHIQ